MTPEERTAVIENAIAALKQAADSLSSALPELRAELKSASEDRQQLDSTSRMLMEAEAQLSKVSASLDSIEDAVLEAMSTAREGLHDPAVPLQTRIEAAKICKRIFQSLSSAGFIINIPEVGQELATELHNVKGRAKSKLGKSEIADVITWGYTFPSGRGQLADVLVGDGSLAEEEEPEPMQHTAQEGIAMVLDEAPHTTKKKTAAKAGDSLFDHLAEAAERNKQP